MVRKIRFLKEAFYKNDDDQGGAQDKAISMCKDDEIVVLSFTKKNGRMWGCLKPQAFVSHLLSNHGLYEVITRFPHKVYFDIDKKTNIADGMEYLQQVKNIIETFFPTAEFAVSGSFTEQKTSFHIVLNNYTIHNLEERQQMKMITNIFVKQLTRVLTIQFIPKIAT
jgi:hypothetical protein